LAKEKAEVAYEENVITPSEFEELEKKEGKKIKVKKASSEKRPEEAPKPVRRDRATDTEMLLLKTEKLEGKIEAMADFRKAVEERLSSLNQEIGELRSSILERDKSLREIQEGFAKVREISEGIEPEKITGELAKKDEAIEKNQALIESLTTHIKQLRKDIKANSDVLENIRDIKNLANIIQTLKNKMGKIEEDRKFTSRTAGKIETMFSELSDKLGDFQSYKDKITFNEDTMHEIMKTMDMLETKLEETSKKDDLKKLEGSIDEKFERARTETDDKFYDVRNLIDDLLAALKNAGIKGVLEKVGKVNLERTFATKTDVEEVRTKLESLREAAIETAREKQREFAREGPKPSRQIPEAPLRETPEKTPAQAQQAGQVSPVLGIQDKVDSMIDQAEEAIKMGNLDIARNLYREALSLYNQLNQAESYQEAMVIYDRIKSLYSRLRIYS
jgi:chromosome segregation ATPase